MVMLVPGVRPAPVMVTKKMSYELAVIPLIARFAILRLVRLLDWFVLVIPAQEYTSKPATKLLQGGFEDARSAVARDTSPKVPELEVRVGMMDVRSPSPGTENKRVRFAMVPFESADGLKVTVKLPPEI